LPLYFTFSGLRTNIGDLNDAKSWGLTLLIIVTACIGKGAGATLAARFLKNSWRDSFTIGILMNTKGLVELIVLNVGLDVGVLNTKVFTMFVIMALVTTFITTPLVHVVYLRRNKELVSKALAAKHPFSVVLNVTNAKVARKMISVSSLFSSEDGMLVKVLLLKEISDRPSTFFFGEMYHGMIKDTKPLIPGTKDRREQKGVSSELSTFAQSLELNITTETKVLITANIEKDVVSYTEQRSFDLALFQLHSKDKNMDDGMNPESKQTIFESLALASGSALENTLEKVFNWSPSSVQIVQRSLDQLHTKVAVLFTTPTHNIPECPSRILFLWNSKEYERPALKLIVKRIPSKMNVTILAKDAASVQGEDLPSNVEVRQTSGELEWTKEVQKNYDILLVGISRKTSLLEISRTELIQLSPIPVVAIFPGLESGANTVNLPEITDDPV